MIIPDPTTRKIVQTNRSNILSTLWSTFNIDLQDNLGVFRISNKLKIISKTGDSGAENLGVPIGYKGFDGLMWTIAGTRVFKNSKLASQFNTLTAFIEDASSGVSTSYDDTYSDMDNFNGALVTTTETKLYSKVSNGLGTGAWTDRGNLSSGNPHKLIYFKKFDREYILNGSEVQSMDTSFTVATTGDYYIALTNYGVLTSGIATTDRIWIAVSKTISGSSGFTTGCSMIEWDGISNEITNEYKIPASGILVVGMMDNSPYVLDSNGILRFFNGSSFSEYPTGSRFPLRKGQTLGQYPSNATNDRFIHPNGTVFTPDGTILFLVNNRDLYQTGSTEHINENLPAGIWEWSKDNGLVHKYSFSTSGVSSGITVDYGQNRLARVGGLALVKLGIATAQNTLLAGAQYYTDATSTTYGIFTDSPFPTTDTSYLEGQKYGYIVTAWILSTALKDTWKKIGAMYRKLLNSTDRLWLKYRTNEIDPVEISITWGTVFPDRTSFTTTTDASAYTGYEVEVVQGQGSPKCSHIKSVVNNAGTYTVLLDEPYLNVSGTAKVRIQNWIKIGKVSDQTTESILKTLKSISSYRIQIKCCMQFTGDNELYGIALINSPQTLLQ